MTSVARALVLDRQHRVLVHADGRAPELAQSASLRPYAALRAAVRERWGLSLPYPAGSRVPEGGGTPREFTFVMDAAPAPEGLVWRPLSEASADEWIWRTYVELMLGGWQPPTRALDVCAFGHGGEQPALLAHLVVCGDKRATATWLRAAELTQSTLATPGLVSIVTDAFGFPRCAIRTEELTRVRFRDVPEALAALEGEGDRTLDDWRQAHLDYFEDEARRLGAAFDEDELVLVERFRVLAIIGRADARREG